MKTFIITLFALISISTFADTFFDKNFTGKYIDRYCDDADETLSFEWDEYATNRFQLFDSSGNEAPMVFQVSEDGKSLYVFEEFVEGSSDNYGDVYRK